MKLKKYKLLNFIVLKLNIIQKPTGTSTNILAHATNAYMINKELCKGVKYSNINICYLKGKLKDTEMIKKKKKQ